MRTLFQMRLRDQFFLCLAIFFQINAHSVFHVETARVELMSSVHTLRRTHELYALYFMHDLRRLVVDFDFDFDLVNVANAWSCASERSPTRRIYAS